MRVLIVSGFLGSGKTTFIQELARRTGKDFVIYENEYGQADIDAKTLRSDTELEVWESTENCICCSGKQDFASSVLTISNTLDPDYLVVEPTGVAKLSNVLDNVRKINYDRIALLKPIAIIDGGVWERQRSTSPDIWDDQAMTASTLVVSKVGAEEDEAMIERLRKLNPHAEIIAQPYAQLEDSWWEALLAKPLDEEEAKKLAEQGSGGDEEANFETMTIAYAEQPSPCHLIWILDALVSGVFGKIARAKGYLPCRKQWLRFDVVDRAWAITGTEPEDESRAIFIGQDLNRNALREVFVPALWQDQAEIPEHDHSHCDHEHGHCLHDHKHEHKPDHDDHHEHADHKHHEHHEHDHEAGPKHSGHDNHHDDHEHGDHHQK